MDQPMFFAAHDESGKQTFVNVHAISTFEIHRNGAVVLTPIGGVPLKLSPGLLSDELHTWICNNPFPPRSAR